MNQRSYDQLCSVALALDVVGDRWSLLILRELFAGPKRFTDIAAGLPGVGTAILSERLRQLEHDGVVSRQRLGPPAPAALYQLTERGLALEPVLSGLAHWGASYLAGRPGLETRGRWLLQAMVATAPRPRPRDIETTNFILDGEESHVLAGKLRVGVRDGLDPTARVTVRAKVRDLHSFATSAHKLKFEVDGERHSAERLLNYLRSGMPGA